MSKYIAYTDGGCQNTSVYGEGGSAYLIIHKGEVVKTASKGFLYTTNNRMEMLAIISAVCSVPEGSDLTVYSDSKYAINVFSGIWKPKKKQRFDNQIQRTGKDTQLCMFSLGKRT